MRKSNESKLNEIYLYTVEYVKLNGFPPSIREICKQCNIKSTATAFSYLEKLRSQGLLEKNPNKKRAITLMNDVNNFRAIPIIGTIRAGSPIFAVENLDGYIPLPEEFDSGENEFALKVQGNSMINAGIYENDIIIVKQQNTAENGEIVVALVDDCATVKKFYKKNNKVILHPENDDMQDMIFDSVEILGIVKGLMRKF